MVPPFCSSPSYFKKAHLFFFFFKPGHIPKNLIIMVTDSISFTDFMEQLHQFFLMWAGNLIGIAIQADILLLQAGEMPVQLGIKIFPVSFPQCQPHAEIDDSLYAGVRADFQNAPDIFIGVVDKRQNRTQPDDGWNSRNLKLFQSCRSFGCGAFRLYHR